MESRTLGLIMLVKAEPVHTNAYLKAVAGAILLFIMPLEGMLQSALANTGSTVVYDFQQALGTPAGYGFFEGLSYLGSEWVLLLLSPVLYHCVAQRTAVKVVLVLCMAQYCNSIVNMIYCEPRPFWVKAGITGEICLEGYASPSDNLTTFTVAYFYTAVFLLQSCGFYLRYALYSLGLVLTFLLGLGQVYLGVLFIHQALTTLCFAFMFLVIAVSIDFFLDKIVKVSAFSYYTNRVNTVYWFVFTMALLLGAIAVYDIITIQEVIDLDWVKNATEDCNIEFDVGSDYSFFVSAAVFYNFGLMLGSMHVTKVLPEYWNQRKLWQKAITAVIAIAVTVGLYYLFSKCLFRCDSGERYDHEVLLSFYCDVLPGGLYCGHGGLACPLPAPHCHRPFFC